MEMTISIGVATTGSGAESGAKLLAGADSRTMLG
jgi:PleD family two-component response regulator